MWHTPAHSCRRTAAAEIKLWRPIPCPLPLPLRPALQRFFSGSIAHLFIYDTALTPDQMQLVGAGRLHLPVVKPA